MLKDLMSRFAEFNNLSKQKKKKEKEMISEKYYFANQFCAQLHTSHSF